MKVSIVLTSVPLVLLLSGALEAQVPVMVELRGGASVPTSSPDEGTLRVGAGLEVSGGVQLLPQLHGSVGWSWRRFASEGATPATSGGVRTSGATFGLTFLHPITQGFTGWVRAGGFYDRVEVTNAQGTVLAENGNDLGWEAGLGLYIPLGDRFAITPGARYRSISANFDEGPVATPFDLRYVVIDVGMSARLWGRGGPSIPVR